MFNSHIKSITWLRIYIKIWVISERRMDMLLQMDFSIRKLEEFLSHSRIIYAWKKFHIWNRRKDLPNSRFIYPDKDSFIIVLVLKAIPCDLAHALARPRVILFPSSATNGNTFSSHHWDRGFKFFFFGWVEGSSFTYMCGNIRNFYSFKSRPFISWDKSF